MGWQVEAVARALAAAGLGPQPPVVPVLCFIDGEWPTLWPPEQFRGVRLESKKSIKKLLAAPETLDPSAIARIYQAMAIAFPAK